MKLDLITVKQDEYYTPQYAIDPLLAHIKARWANPTIWCPFDTEDSLYVKTFRALGWKVHCTHIQNGQDFFQTQETENIDIIVSNPPYSLKNEVFESLFARKVPFAMLVGVVGIFESKKRFNLFKDNDFEIMYFDKRISYFKDYNDPKPSLNPPFSSVYICQGLLPSKIIFQTINKK